MRVSKWGNSLAVRLPKTLVDELELIPGDTLDVFSADSDRIVLARSKIAKQKAAQRMRKRAFRIPSNYAFDRDDVNTR